MFLWRGISNSLPPICGSILGFVGWRSLECEFEFHPLAICGLRLGLFWVTFFGANFDSIPPICGSHFDFCWVSVLRSDFEFHPLHFCGYHFWVLVGSMFWGEFQFHDVQFCKSHFDFVDFGAILNSQLLQFGVHILGFVGWIFFRASFELQSLICLSSCSSCFVSGLRMVGECYCTQKRLSTYGRGGHACSQKLTFKVFVI